MLIEEIRKRFAVMKGLSDDIKSLESCLNDTGLYHIHRGDGTHALLTNNESSKYRKEALEGLLRIWIRDSEARLERERFAIEGDEDNE